MLYQISNGTVSVGGELILSHIDFEIRGNEKIAVVGKNGAGKTTLLNLVAGTRRSGDTVFAPAHRWDAFPAGL